MKKIWLSLILLTIPVFGFWINPQQTAVKDLKTAIASLEAQTAEHQKQMQMLQKADKFLQDEKYKDALEQIPPTLEQETLILALEEMAQSTGFVFDDISFSRGQNAELETSTLNANFEVRGREDKFLDFLQAIETENRFMGLTSFSYSISEVNDIRIVSLSVPLYAFAQSSEN